MLRLLVFGYLKRLLWVQHRWLDRVKAIHDMKCLVQRTMQCGTLPVVAQGSTYLHRWVDRRSGYTLACRYRCWPCSVSKAQSSPCPDGRWIPAAQKRLWWQAWAGHRRCCWRGCGCWVCCHLPPHTQGAAGGVWLWPSPPGVAPWTRERWIDAAGIPSHRQTGCLH